jgi:hypothetical protein
LGHHDESWSLELGLLQDLVQQRKRRKRIRLETHPADEEGVHRPGLRIGYW